ncbi:hypothetical protein [Undibacterium sp.]|jgi:hypothetical protein|uniref:hypothetical protein n=1 Tax=Undibacterium sp. TaxID=1914977 RepID=UPI002CE95981|nr:hypothetical protein [Undibacterium sp.]HTD03725.1 hypothetical protein [Undibacterium sp.]
MPQRIILALSVPKTLSHAVFSSHPLRVQTKKHAGRIAHPPEGFPSFTQHAAPMRFGLNASPNFTASKLYISIGKFYLPSLPGWAL